MLAKAAAAVALATVDSIKALTPADVEKVLRRAVELGDGGDHEGQCALAAKELKFSLTDHNTNPKTVLTGGREALCDMQRQSAQVLQTTDMRSASSLDHLVVRVATGGKQASAEYDLMSTFSEGGQPVLTVHCARKDELVLQGGRIVFKRAVADCKPLG